MKKVIKFVPFVTIVLVTINIIVTTYFNAGTLVNSFGADDILAIFSHADGGHIAWNMGMLLVLGSMAELLLKDRRWVYISMIVVTMVSVIINNEITSAYTIGASGWVMAVPFILVFAGLLFWYENRRYNCEYLGRVGAIIGSVFGFGIMVVDYALLQDKAHMSTTGINHATHLCGELTGIVLALIAGAIYAVKLLKK